MTRSEVSEETGETGDSHNTVYLRRKAVIPSDSQPEGASYARNQDLRNRPEGGDIL